MGRPSTELTSKGVVWPFAQWGIDLVGPLPRSEQRTYIIVTIDYFSKWMEAKALTSTTKFQVIKFLKSRIISILEFQVS